MKKKTFSLSGIAVAACILSGCSKGNEPIVQNQQSIQSAKTLRAYFDQCQGDFNALSASDKAAAEKAAGGTAADVQKEFDFMKTSNKTPAKS